uniref:Fungal lipase-type domain-containing protein n=1 Tax=Timspurckia oligopyrenoides TaxID=708627 RepID=A0A7S0ZI62_9RHOD|mmetsp:Transcript_629/g.1131  ORF Transcript_629/g.1131 Transcript_629/m.1131 type:complete len:650 (+) Transcript_629:160-2109(+)
MEDVASFEFVSGESVVEEDEEVKQCALKEFAKLGSYVGTLRSRAAWTEDKGFASGNAPAKTVCKYACPRKAKKMKKLESSKSANDGREYLVGIEDSDDDGENISVISEDVFIDPEFDDLSAVVKRKDEVLVDERVDSLSGKKVQRKSIARMSEKLLGKFPSLMISNKSQKSLSERSASGALRDVPENDELTESEVEILKRATTKIPEGFSEEVCKSMVEYTTAAYCRIHNASSYECGCGSDASLFQYTGRYTNAKYDSSGFVGIHHTGKYIVAAFRGTVSLKNWISNVKTVTMEARKAGGVYAQLPSDVKVHLGFWQTFASIGTEMVQEVLRLHNENPGYLVYVTGHSLGGAMATHCALYLALSGVSSNLLRVYTFGQPRVGTDAFRREFNARINQFYRIVNNHDIVPHLPSMATGFRHVGEEMWFSTELTAVQTKQLIRKNAYAQSKLIDKFTEYGLMNQCANSTPFVKLGIVDHLLYYDRVTGKHRLRGAPPPIRPIKSDGRREVVSENIADHLFDCLRNVILWIYSPQNSCCKNKVPFKRLIQHVNEELEAGNDMALTVLQIDGTKNDLPEQYQPKGATTVYYKPAGPRAWLAKPVLLEKPVTFENLLELVEEHWVEPQDSFLPECLIRKMAQQQQIKEQMVISQS